MVQFSRLRLSGFKSFPERTELEIGHGLTGVVGPNGCGKSNLLEALRWVMGENSAKRMRGGGMEDVIFNGTDKRSARNIAEVSLVLENHKHDAPAPYTPFDEIEITRRIERDYGSAYKINGKTVRARDVQMLFADTVTGANSPAMVSQGRVTQMINAKPQERRLILEESAGISGLYARRHEAELRLRAAEKNMERIGDMLGSIEGRYQALKRQARQAAKYRNLNAQIRQMDLMIAYLEWLALHNKAHNEEKNFGDIESQVVEMMTTVSQLSKTEQEQRKELEPLLAQDAEFLAKIQTQRIALERLEEEQQRAQNTLNETKADLEQTQSDLSHEQTSHDDGQALVSKLKEEEKTLIESQPRSEKLLAEKLKKVEELAKSVKILEEQNAQLLARDAENRAKKNALITQIEKNTARLNDLNERIAKAKETQEQLKSRDTSNEEALLRGVEAISEQIINYHAQNDGLKAKQDKAEENVTSARETQRIAEKTLNDLEAELSLLENLVATQDQDGMGVLDELQASDGFETAISRALGDSMQASLDKDARKFWRENDNVIPQDLPSGLESLLPHVKAPKALHLGLSQIGYVESFEDGETFFNQLLPGQSIVSLQGHYWRWDGFCMKAEASDQNAVFLEQKNALQKARGSEKAIRSAAQKAQGLLDDALKAYRTLQAEKDHVEGKLKSLDQDIATKRQALNEEREKNASLRQEQENLKTLIHLTQNDVGALEETLGNDQKQLSVIEAIEKEQGNEAPELDTVQNKLKDQRELHQDALRDHDRFEQDLRTRQARLQAIADERITVQNRTIRSAERIKTLIARKDELELRLQSLQNSPDENDHLKQSLLNKISALEAEHKQKSEKKSSLEIDLAETVKGLKQAEADLAALRESRAASGALVQALKEQLKTTVQNTLEKFEMQPEALRNHISLDDEALESKRLEQCKNERESLSHQRNALGAVNLRAEEEAQELEQELGTIFKEKEDLESAIAELRSGINKINKEARVRLLAAFDHVNGHFKELFGRLFEGGKAHLALIDSDDPLGAGLEIFAQPPGKTLQSLSLLSGGEQTLASIALIFAMFLTNPSPICVLDEVDAPLDDANVDRFCDVLDDIAMRGTTRFLIITHHRLTMARMDRLFGVTMSEKGVSQLISVDLQQSFAFSGDNEETEETSKEVA